MKKHGLLVALATVVGLQVATAQDSLQEKVIYKWNQGGLIYYSHIKPAGLKNYIKLDNTGRRIEDISDDFGEIVEVVVRPNEAAMNDKPQNNGKATTVSEQLKKGRAEEQKQKNCETSKRNLATLDSGEVYEKDSSGSMVRLTAEQLASKRKNVQRDVDYFCN